MPIRTPGMRQTIEFTLPGDDAPTVTLAKASNRDNISRMNMLGKMRWIQNSNTPDEVITERDIPMGDLQVSTLLLLMVAWDIVDARGNAYPITEDNIMDLLRADEQLKIYNQILKINPVFRNEEEEKNDSSETSVLSLSASSEEESSETESAPILS